MLPFAHVGIALGAAMLMARAVPHAASSERPGGHGGSAGAEPGSARDGWIPRLARCLEVRFLLVGSLLPDFIDKPVGTFLFRDTFGSGRIFCHTLLFTLVLAVPGVYLHLKRKGTWLAALATGCFTHLVLDAMWLDARTLLWPLYGVTFERTDLEGWIPHILDALVTKPNVFVPELVGLVVVTWFGWILVHRKTLRAFVRHGRIN